MKLVVLIALTVAITAALAASGVDAASCTTKKHYNCLNVPATVNFSSVPDISKEIVNDEPAAAKPATRTLEAPPITTYTGPMVGAAPNLARAPMVGYYWSLEPDSSSH
jgi:hypothetical protein